MQFRYETCLSSKRGTTATTRDHFPNSDFKSERGVLIKAFLEHGPNLLTFGLPNEGAKVHIGQANGFVFGVVEGIEPNLCEDLGNRV